MTNQKKYHRLSVKIGTETNQRLDEISYRLGMSKSGLVAYYLGKMIDQESKAQEILKDLTKPESLMKMFENNPGLLAQLESENQKHEEEE